MSFQDHFSAGAVHYAAARPEYPDALYAWMRTLFADDAHAWEAGCGSGQASRGLAGVFAHVHATDPSQAQLAGASAPPNVAFAVGPGERSGLADASVEAVCVAQALHWFDRGAFFAECARVLKPGGVLLAWGYQDIEVPPAVAAANARFQQAILGDWPPERADVDAAYAGYAWPFPALSAPAPEMVADWPLQRLLDYFASFSASKRHRERTGIDPVAVRAPEFAAAWGDPAATQRLRWPLFVHARRKPAGW